jgi:hypothetical protein
MCLVVGYANTRHRHADDNSGSGNACCRECPQLVSGTSSEDVQVGTTVRLKMADRAHISPAAVAPYSMADPHPRSQKA